MTKKARIYNGEKIAFSINGVGKTRPFIEKAIFSPLYILAFFVID